MTTERKVIRGLLARQIAGRIASKAMEHLEKPLKDKRIALAKTAARNAIEDAGISTRESMEKVSKLFTGGGIDYVDIMVMRNGGQDERVAMLSHGVVGEDKYLLVSHRIYLSREDDIAALRAASKEIDDLHAKQRSLMNKLYMELEMRTVKQAIEAWPEAADIIREEAGVGVKNPNPMEQPLANILAAYMPALPAPKTSEGEAA